MAETKPFGMYYLYITTYKNQVYTSQHVYSPNIWSINIPFMQDSMFRHVDYTLILYTIWLTQLNISFIIQLRRRLNGEGIDPRLHHE